MEIYNGKLTGNFDNDTAVLDAVLRTDASFDMLRKTMEVAGARIVMYYIDGFVKAESLQKHGLITIDNDHIALTVKGFLVSNSVIWKLLAPYDEE